MLYYLVCLLFPSDEGGRAVNLKLYWECVKCWSAAAASQVALFCISKRDGAVFLEFSDILISKYSHPKVLMVGSRYKLFRCRTAGGNRRRQLKRQEKQSSHKRVHVRSRSVH